MNDTQPRAEPRWNFCLVELEQLVGQRNVHQTLRIFLEGANSLAQQLSQQLRQNKKPAPAVIRRGAHQMRSAAKQLKMVSLEQAAAAILYANAEHATDKALVEAFHAALWMSIQEVERYFAEHALTARQLGGE